MQTIGEGKTFLTLFRELRLDDERIAPQFSVVWNRANAQTRPHGRLNLSYVVGAFVIVSVLSLAIWFMERPRIGQHDNNAIIQSSNPVANTVPETSESSQNQSTPRRTTDRVKAMRRAMRLEESRRARLLALSEADFRNALVVSSWQSPTAMLMQSPADDLLSSLPQLYRTVSEANLFLSDNQK